MKNIYEQVIAVDSSAIDRNGHVNNVVYLQWMQDIAVAHSKTWESDAMMDELGAAWFARKQTIEYLLPIFEGEEITARTWIATVERVKSKRAYEFLRDGKIVATGETDWVCVHRVTGRPMRIPARMHEFVLLKR